MGKYIIGRRPFLAGAGALATGGAGALRESFAQETLAVPNSAGTATPQLKVPAGACDCHHHIYDARFPFSRPGARMVTDSRVSDYRLLQRRLGITQYRGDTDSIPRIGRRQPGDARRPQGFWR